MKIKFNSLHAIALLGLLSFASCKKDDAPPPDPQPNGPELIEEIQGKWTITPPAGRIKVSAKTQESGPSTYMLEFLSDKTFIIDLGGGATFHRSFSIEDKTIALDDLATITNVKRTNDKLSFRIRFSEALDEELDGVSLNLTAQKVTPLQVPAGIKDITKKWYLDLNSAYDGNELLALAASKNADRVESVFTVNGTIYTEFFRGDARLLAGINMWKMHETENGIVEYNEHADGEGYYKVTLEGNALELEHFVAAEGDDDGGGSDRKADQDGDDAPAFVSKGKLSFSSEKPVVPATRTR